MLKYRNFVCAAALAGLPMMFAASSVSAGERMTDRCSSRVAIPTTGYSAPPDVPGTVILERPASGYSPWTAPFSVALGPNKHIRWWCNSTTGNWADPGTWEFRFDLPKALKCAVEIAAGAFSGDIKPEDLLCVSGAVSADPGAKARDGWTAERSRCNNRSNVVRARLGPDRLLQIECLGSAGRRVSPLHFKGKSFDEAGKSRAIIPMLENQLNLAPLFRRLDTPQEWKF